MENHFKFSWEYSDEKYPMDTSKKPLPIFYDFYDPVKDFENVYEPAEDSFLLIDSIEMELEHMKFDKTQKIKSVELGCGSGLISICYLSKLRQLNINNYEHYCIDINKDAVDLTQRLLKNYKLDEGVKVKEGDLFNNFDENMKFDIIIFNPPYVTTDKEEYEKALKEKNIYAAWAGGDKGSETINRFVKDLKNFINDNTVIFLLLSKENEYGNIINNMKELYNMDWEILMRKRYKNERLAVIKFQKNFATN